MTAVRVGLVGAGFMGEAQAARFGIPYHSGRWGGVIENPAIEAPLRPGFAERSRP